MALSNKQRVFVEKYLVCWNATEAARQAGYAFPNVEGPKNLVNPSIAEAIKERIAQFAMSADEVLIRLAEQARGSMADFISDDGELALGKAQSNGKLHLVKSYHTTDKGVRIELYDAQAALVHLGRHHKLFTDRVEHDFGRMNDEQLRNFIRAGLESLSGGNGGSEEAGD